MGEIYKRQEDGDGDDRGHEEENAPSWNLYLRALVGRALDEVEGRGALKAATNDVIDHDGELVQENVRIRTSTGEERVLVVVWTKERELVVSRRRRGQRRGMPDGLEVA
jgi:hypothetical protein